MENNIVEQVRKFVEEECRKPTAKYGKELYEFHFVPVYKYAVLLAERLGADVEIVGLAAWFHDIGSTIYGRENHHITGAEIAEEKLMELGYPRRKIGRVKACILNHRGSVNNNRKTTEEKILADADSIVSFDSLPGIFKAAFVYEGLTQGEARISVRKKLQGNWEKLSLEESKRIIKPKYEAAMLLLS